MESEMLKYVSTDKLERLYLTAVMNEQYWKVRVDIWEDSVISRTDALSRRDNDLFGTKEELDKEDDAEIEMFLIGYWDALAQYYQHNLVARAVFEEIGCRRLAEFTGEGNFKVEIDL
jgi:hypothetical protein